MRTSPTGMRPPPSWSATARLPLQRGPDPRPSQPRPDRGDGGPAGHRMGTPEGQAGLAQSGPSGDLPMPGAAAGGAPPTVHYPTRSLPGLGQGETPRTGVGSPPADETSNQKIEDIGHGFFRGLLQDAPGRRSFTRPERGRSADPGRPLKVRLRGTSSCPPPPLTEYWSFGLEVRRFVQT